MRCRRFLWLSAFGLCIAPFPVLACYQPPSAFVCTLGDFDVRSPPEPSFFAQVAAANAALLVRAQTGWIYQVRFVTLGTLKGTGAPAEITLPGMLRPCRESPDELYVQLTGVEGWDSNIFVPVQGEADPRVAQVREYISIAAIADAGERRTALAALRERAAADPAAYPADLSRDVDRQLSVPSALDSFADLAAMYDHASSEDDRLDALSSMDSSGHPETPRFFLDLLASGVDLGSGLVSVSRWFERHPDRESLAGLTVAIRRAADVAGRRRATLSLLAQAGAADATLVASLFDDAAPEMQMEIAAWLAEHAGLRAARPEAVRRYRSWPEAKKLDFLERMLTQNPGMSTPWIHDLVRRGDDPQGRVAARLAAGGTNALLVDLGREPDPARRRALFVALFGRPELRSWAPLWRLAQAAHREELKLVLDMWCGAMSRRQDRPLLATEELSRLVLGARSARALDRAFLLASVDRPDLVVPLAERAAAAGRFPRTGLPRSDRGLDLLGRAFLSAGLAGATLLDPIVDAAGPGDEDLLLALLPDCDKMGAETLAPFFARHPTSAAIPGLRRHFEPWSHVAEALAAAADPGIVRWARGILNKPWPSSRETRNAVSLLARSPLPEATQEIRGLLAGGEQAISALHALTAEDNANPERWALLAEAVRSGSRSAEVEEALRSGLGSLSEKGDAQAAALLALLPQPAPVVP
jgi:hypothetical protein